MKNESLKAWRQRLRLSQPDMAGYVGCNVSSWIQWERLLRKPPMIAENHFAMLHRIEREHPQWHAEICVVLPKKPAGRKPKGYIEPYATSRPICTEAALPDFLVGAEGRD